MMIFQAILSFAALGLTSVSGFTSKASTAPAMVDECDLGTDNCDTNASCENTDDHTHTHTEALIDYECTCNSGFTGDGLTCDDDNECELDTANCDDNESCENTAGSFECTPCESGFTGDGFTCADDNECELETDDCDDNASCENTDGSFECTCDTGFAGDGSICADINECSYTDDCDDNASCENTAGSFVCTCESGFTGDGLTCADDNECELETDDCDANASCENTVGSFECTCDTGFAGDGSICADNNECELNTDDCDDNHMCVNTAGSFECSCENGFTFWTCKADEAVKSEIDAACPSGYGLINDEATCFAAYDVLKGGNSWSDGKASGTWGHVMQCGVHIASTKGANNGNTKVHFKTNGVDGSTGGEDWVHLCQRTSAA